MTFTGVRSTMADLTPRFLIPFNSTGGRQLTGFFMSSLYSACVLGALSPAFMIDNLLPSDINNDVDIPHLLNQRYPWNSSRP